MKTQLDSRKHAASALKAFLTTSLAVLTAALSVQAQTEVSPDRGFTPAASYNISDIETINTTNGNLMLRVPVGALPAGRAGMSGVVSLVYNSKLWDSSCDGTAVASNQQIVVLNGVKPSQRGGWRYAIGYSLELHNIAESACPGGDCTSATQAQQWKLLLVFPDGSHHIMYPQGYAAIDGYTVVMPDGTVDPLCGNRSTITGTLTYYSLDGSFIRLDIQHDSDSNPNNNPYTIYFPDGGRVTGGPGPQRIFDRNNNFVEIENIIYNTHPSTRVIDQLGRSVIVEYDAHPNEDVIHATGFNNQELLTTIKWRSIRVYKDYDSGNPAGLCLCSQLVLDASLRVVDRITLPAQSGSLSYVFDYNATATNPFPSYGWGELSSVTLPTGARADYSYVNDGTNGWNKIRTEDIVYNRPTRKDLTYLLEYDGSVTSRTDTWLYFIDPFEGMSETIAPDGGSTVEVFGSPVRGGDGVVVKTDSRHTTVERIWQENLPFGIVPEHVGVNINPYLKTEFTSVKDATGNPVKTSIKDFAYDKNGNVTSVIEYDWVNYASVPRSGATGLPTGIPSGSTILRKTVNTYYGPTPDASDTITDDPDVYHRSTSASLRKAIESNEIRGQGDVVVARREFSYDNATTTGNLTQQRDWDSAKGTLGNDLTDANSIAVFREYDSFGNTTKTIDALEVETEFVYGSINGFADLYVTVRRDALGTSVQRTTNMDYDFYTGVVTLSTDADNNVSTRTSYDALGRPILVQEAYLTSIEKQTAVEYSDSARRVITRSDLDTKGDGKLVRIEHYDQLGRIRLTRQLEDSSSQSEPDETTGIKVQTRYRYNGANSFILSSNPYRASTSGGASVEPTMGWSRAKRDSGGRLVEVQGFGGATLPAPWGSNTSSTGVVTTSYNANATVVTDQAGKIRRSITDGLGRLTRVDEPNSTGQLDTTQTPSQPIQPTSYEYDALDNLTKVTQSTQAQRIYTYSSLARLISARNPESGTISYVYDNNGNLTQKTDARGVICDYIYDLLNRIKTRSYTLPAGVAATPTVSYTYDDPDVLNSKGRLTRISSAVSVCDYLEYDKLGRVKRSKQTTDSIEYPFVYGWDLAGNMTSEQYPSDRGVTNTFDAAGRLSGISGLKESVTTAYASGMTYAAHGGLVSTSLAGGGMNEQMGYNSRLQPTLIELRKTAGNELILGLDYTYNTPGQTNNNGNVHSQAIRIGTGGGTTTINQSYSYDELNRLKTASEPTWTQTYGYDRWGNRTSLSNTGSQGGLLPTQTTPAVDATNNRLAGFTYDTAGNMKQDLAANQYDYDGENKMTSCTVGGTPSSYSYDGAGHRIKKVVGNGASAVTTVFVYNATGQLIAEYMTGNASGSGTSYLTTDHLGSTRVVTGLSTGGTVSVKARYDYCPFGEEIGAGIGSRTAALGYGSADGTRQKFTQKERDIESGLDFFGERYYSSSAGRFTTVDPLGSSIRAVEPQTMNRYVFVLNNPLRYVDPDGLDATDNDYWSRLTDRERQILASRLTDVEHSTAPTQPELQAAGEAFNRMLTRLNGDGTAPSPADVASRFLGVLNFIDAIGARKNSDLWQDIKSITGVFDDPNNKIAGTLIEVEVRRVDTFEWDLKQAGYAVNKVWDKIPGISKHPNITARQRTGTSWEPGLHLANDQKSRINTFWAHWDPRSSNFAVTTYPGRFGSGRAAEMAHSGLTHGQGISNLEVREYLKRTGVAPKSP
jgi:RHS repeat-associated protein